MAGTGEVKKEEADYKRLHSFPLIRVRQGARMQNKNICSVITTTCKTKVI